MTDAIAEVRRLMKERGMSLRATAKAAGYDASYISKILNGKKPWSADIANHLDNALDADGTIRDAPAPAPLIPRDVVDRQGLYDVSDADEMRRRAFLLNVAALTGLGIGNPTTAVEAVRNEVHLSIAEPCAIADIDEWNEIILEYGESYPTTAPVDLIAPLMADMLNLQAALHQEPEARGQLELCRVLALLSAFTAQTLCNMGHVHEARRWWRTAKSTADRSGDSYSMLWVRGREITRSMESRPVAGVLRLIEEATGLSDNSPSEAALELLGGKAQTLALADRAQEAQETLELLEKQFSESSAGYSGSVLAWGQERLYNTESFTYSRLGKLRECEKVRARGLALYEPGNLRWPAGLELNLAWCLVRSGDITEGLNHSRAIIDGLPESHRTRPILNDACKLLYVIPAGKRQAPVALEYREWLEQIA